MIRHNLLLIYRNFKRHKSSFIINLTSLSTGMACALLIYLWVNDELHTDKFNENDDRLFQVLQNIKQDNTINTAEFTPGPLPKSLAEEIPEVEYAVGVIPPTASYGKGVISTGTVRFKAKGQFAGKDFFNVFSYPLLQGDKNRVLAEKQGVVLSEDLALKLFNTTENIIGKSVNWNEEEINGLYFVSGVFKQVPGSARPFDLLLNYDLFLEKHEWLQAWDSNDPSTYVVLKKGVSAAQFNKKIAGFLKSKDKDSEGELVAQLFSDRYLHGKFENGVQSGGRIEYVKLFSLIAVFILGIACINFMNLSTARAARRSKEVGIKKVVGARRQTLILQYLGESVLLSLVSLIIAVLLVALFIPAFNDITGKQLTLRFDARLILTCVGIALASGIIAGSYPSLYLSGFRPVAILKGRLKTSLSELWIRKGLVVFQFALSVILIVSVLVVYKQMDFVQSKNLGYSRDNVLYFDTEKASESFLAELKRVPGVVNASAFFHDMTGDHGGTRAVDWEGRAPDFYGDFGNLEAGYDIIETLGFEITSGRSFSRELAPGQIIFNESAIKLMGLKDPVGKTVKLWGNDRTIVGVVRDFHFESLYKKIEPCFIQLVPAFPATTKVMVKIKGGTEKATIDKLQQFYKAYNPGIAFGFTFLDEDYQTLYTSEKKVSVLSRYFAGLAILISCLGLFGLAAFTAEKRKKEISIRKVLGASVKGVSFLLTKEFVKLVLLANVIAWPVAYYFVLQWLQDFTYKIDINIWMFLLAGLAAIIITIMTVGFQAIKAAVANPVKSLRTE
jgi:putative ABC transport system permease protein